MLLFELLNKPGQWEEIEAAGDDWKAEMKMPDGRVIEFHIHEGHYPNTAEIEFSDKSQTRIGDSVGITGEGGELVIFSTALEIINEFFQKNPDKVLFFSASERNRASLYARMLNRKLPPGYETFTNEEQGFGGTETYFYIGKPEPLKQMTDEREKREREFAERR